MRVRVLGIVAVLVAGCGSTQSSSSGSSSSSTASSTSGASTSGSTGTTTSGSTTTSSSSTSTSSSSGSTGSSAPMCTAAGNFCGSDGIQNGEPNTLYHCAGAGAPTSSEFCAAGCGISSSGDACNAPSTSGGSGSTSGSTGSTTGSSQPICPGAGPYCGSDGVTNGDANTLYQCPAAGQPPSTWTACANGCSVQAAGTADFCNGSSVVCPGSGAYCGSDGVTGGDANTLYQCPGAGLAPGSSTPCSNGCSTQPSGTPDFCAGATPVCQGQYAGAYCGNDSVTNGDANTLYQCPGANQAPTSAQSCANGCSVQSSGTPDFCVGSQPVCNGSNAGYYCGSDSMTGADANTLYHCVGAGQAPDSATPCSAGCSVQSAGTDDRCSVVCTGSAAGYYCGGDSVSGGDPNTLYHCAGANQAPDSSTPCSAGCSVQSAGTDDFCNNSCNATENTALGFEAQVINSGRGGACSGSPPNCYSDYCLGLVNSAFQSAGDYMSELQQYSAVDSLHAFQNSGDFTAWNGSCPCGAILFWDANSCNGGWGHIVICNGDGTVSTSGWSNYAGSTHASITWLDGEECGHAPAGYAMPH